MESRNGPELVVGVGLLDAFVFGAPVLEPDLDLRLGEAEHGGQLGAPMPAYVLGGLELDFQPQRLLLTERRPLTSLDQALPLATCHYQRRKAQLLFSSKRIH